MKRSVILSSFCFSLLSLGLTVPICAQNDAGTPPGNVPSNRNAPSTQKIILNLPTKANGPIGTLTADRTRYAPGEPVTLTFTVTNPTKAAVNYDFPTGQQYDFSMTDYKSNELWRWSRGRVFTQYLTHLSLKPGEHKTFIGTWNGLDTKGRPVPPGTYLASARLTSNDRPAFTGGIIYNRDVDPNNMGMPTRSPAETGAVRAVNTKPPVTATAIITVAKATPAGQNSKR